MQMNPFNGKSARKAVPNRIRGIIAPTHELLNEKPGG
jgi:hypothetical protein